MLLELGELGPAREAFDAALELDPLGVAPRVGLARIALQDRDAELAAMQLPEDSEANTRLQEIVTASMSATDLCNEMLAYAGQGAVTPENLDLNDLVKEIITEERVSRLISYFLYSALWEQFKDLNNFQSVTIAITRE